MYFKFFEYIKAPEITLKDRDAIFDVVSAFHTMEVVFHVGQEDEYKHPLDKTHPLSESDRIYLSFQKHYKIEEDFIIVENVPYKDLPQNSVEVGEQVGIMLISKEHRFGGYGKILKQVERPITNQGKRLVNKGALFISFPNPLYSINRRQRFRLAPRVEDILCEVSGYKNNRSSPIPSFPVRNISNMGICMLFMHIPSDQAPQAGDILYIRLNLFTPNKGYVLKRGVVVSENEVLEGSVKQEQYVLKCQVMHSKLEHDRAIEVGMRFLGYAREGASVDPAQFSKLTYLDIDPDIGIEQMMGWWNRVQQRQRKLEMESEYS